LSKANLVVKKYHIKLNLLLSLAAVFFGLFIFITGGFRDKDNLVALEFLMLVDKETYEMTDFGEPPQIAVWLESPDGNRMLTVWVARRSGRQLWKGKVECPTALPLWESRHKSEKSSYKKRGLLKRLVDAISGATPTGGPFYTRIKVEKGSAWQCFVEVNLSGDFNKKFPYRHANGMPDPEINGQPSLVYKGFITAVPGRKTGLRLIGRTHQWYAIDYIIKDLQGITSARQAVTNLQVKCKSL
jgi:hypothetical protein